MAFHLLLVISEQIIVRAEANGGDNLLTLSQNSSASMHGVDYSLDECVCVCVRVCVGVCLYRVHKLCEIVCLQELPTDVTL